MNHSFEQILQFIAAVSRLNLNLEAYKGDIVYIKFINMTSDIIVYAHVVVKASHDMIKRNNILTMTCMYTIIIPKNYLMESILKLCVAI